MVKLSIDVFHLKHFFQCGITTYAINTDYNCDPYKITSCNDVLQY